MNLENNYKSKKLRVAVLDDDMPYANCKPTFEGITVDIWKETALKNNLDYEFICYPRNYDDILKKLNNDEIDVVLAEISVVNRRFDWALYTRPFFVSELYIYRKNTNYFLDFFSDTQLKYIFTIVILIIILYTVLLIYVFKFTFINAFYKTLISFLSIGGEIISPNTRYLNKLNIKFLNTIWSFFLFFFRSFILSRIIATVVSKKNIIDADELKQINKVNVLGNSANVDMVKLLGKTPIEIVNSTEIAKKIDKSNGDEYWFEDSNIINSELKKANIISELVTSERPLMNDEFTIAVNKKMPQVLDMINHSLVEMQGNGTMLKICKGYIDNYDRCLL